MQTHMHPHILPGLYSFMTALKAMPAFENADRVKYIQEQIYNRGKEAL